MRKVELNTMTITIQMKAFMAISRTKHCVKSVQIQSIFWSVFSFIRTKYRDLRSKSPYSVRIQENADQTNSVFGHFSSSEEDETKKWIDFELVLSDDYDDYFMKHLINIKDGNDEKYDMLTNKNSKVLFYHFNNYLRQISEPTKLVRHSVVLNDETALEIL